MAEPVFQLYASKSRAGTWAGAPVRGEGQAILSGVAIKPGEEIGKSLRAFGQFAMQQAGFALYRVAEEIMSASKRVVPVDTGNLRASGHVSKQFITTANSVGVVFGYGGPAGVGNVSGTNEKAVGYALPVHERLDVVHKNGQPKYLEAPVLSFAPRIEAMLAKDLQREVSRAGR